MKNIKALSIVALAALMTFGIAGCSKTEKHGVNERKKLIFDSWIQINHPDLKPQGKGIYIIEDKIGEGQAIGEVKDNPYLFVSYSIRDLKGNITTSTNEKTAKQIGTYKETNYYGPIVWTRYDNNMQEGITEAIEGMRDGGTRTVAIPGWLMSYKRYGTAEDYLNLNEKAVTSAVYTITIHGHTKDYKKWEDDSLKRYSDKYLGGIDTLSKGFYYKQTQKPTEDKEMPNDTTVYINYIGRLLNGLVFDTNIEDSAKVYNIYKKDNSYKPMKISWGERFEELKMGDQDNSMIPGFAKALYNMKPGEACTTVFSSSLGYGSRSKGAQIPSFAMLRFDITLVEKENSK